METTSGWPAASRSPSGPVTDEVWKYDIAEDRWTAGPRLPEPGAGGGLAIAGRKLHYFGGYKSDRDTDAADHWSLPLDGGTAWQREADLPDPRVMSARRRSTERFMRLVVTMGTT